MHVANSIDTLTEGVEGYVLHEIPRAEGVKGYALHENPLTHRG